MAPRIFRRSSAPAARATLLGSIESNKNAGEKSGVQALLPLAEAGDLGAVAAAGHAAPSATVRLGFIEENQNALGIFAVLDQREISIDQQLSGRFDQWRDQFFGAAGVVACLQLQTAIGVGDQFQIDRKSVV